MRPAMCALPKCNAIHDHNLSTAIMDGLALRQSEGLRLGRVIAVSACQAIALLEKSHLGTSSSHRDLPLEMGSLVKMQTRVSIAYGMVGAVLFFFMARPQPMPHLQ